MKITNINIRKLTNEEKMKAIVSVTFNNTFVVHDMKIIDGNNGLFIAMPSRKMSDGSYRDIAHPITKDFRKNIENLVIERYIKINKKESNV